ncbi:regulatory protein AsnC [Muribaculaceae bacterium]|jgi:Lrp/AsnC family transcriptional regulator for asnA, asnC and gidA|uniref:Lrp/AsnC family transcriptional regulator n=1 Tax=Paramuribaculum intestinale TaxID=2094151 RepID=UPI000A4A6C46|nr:Lrp/AsnC ligand binding domain-containing protein [Paramuribaculum intestinale]MCX4260627.1 Lrp/AsnC ligand binding domain-containing protein [Muribaculaceae bacterium]GFI06788.1 regulatory protein AsnC [Muribaculaceae bacterium]
MTQYHLDDLDIDILRKLSENARCPYQEIARECGVSGASIHQRIQRLTSLGIIQGSETHIDATALGYSTCAYMGFFLTDPAQFNTVIEKLKDIPEVVECHFTTGKYDIFIKIHARNNEHLLNLIHTKLQQLGTARTETLISFREVFRRQFPIKIDHEE